MGYFVQEDGNRMFEADVPFDGCDGIETETLGAQKVSSCERKFNITD